MDIAELNPDQQATLDQYLAVTDQSVEEAILLLQRCQWNVQIAIARFFDGEPEPEPEPVSHQQDARVHDTLVNSFDNSANTVNHLHPMGRRLLPAPRIVPNPNPERKLFLSFPLNIVFAPFSLASYFVSRLFSILSSFVPILPSIISRLQISTKKTLSPADTASRFIREFDERFGQDGLPFLEKGYAHSLDQAKKELKFLFVVLISHEHQYTESYVKDTLKSREFVEFFRNKDNNVLLWGGDVRESESYQVSGAFAVTKFPYAALIAHTPKSIPRSSPSFSTSGMSIIQSFSGPIQASELISRLRNAMQSHEPELTVLRAENAERQAIRNIQAEQDDAYERSLAKDREKARLKKQEAEKQRQHAESVANAEKEALQAAQLLEQWKLWRSNQIQAEPPASDKNATRVSLRLLNGERVIRRFDSSLPVEEIYALVECWDILQDGSHLQSVPESSGTYHRYEFQLVSPMPRVIHPVENNNTIATAIGRSANLIVEPIEEE